MKPAPANTLQLSLQGAVSPPGHLFLLQTVPSPQKRAAGDILAEAPGLVCWPGDAGPPASGPAVAPQVSAAHRQSHTRFNVIS